MRMVIKKERAAAAAEEEAAAVAAAAAAAAPELELEPDESEELVREPAHELHEMNDEEA